MQHAYKKDILTIFIMYLYILLFSIHMSKYYKSVKRHKKVHLKMAKSKIQAEKSKFFKMVKSKIQAEKSKFFKSTKKAHQKMTKSELGIK